MKTEFNTIGNIHSIETCGTVDGPGVRFVIFMQGCPMRCLYCHNPDTWSFSENKKMSVNEVLGKYDSVKEFCKGGITVTGGEPLCQHEFIAKLFEKAQIRGIHTALDTSGVCFDKDNSSVFDGILNNTSLVLLDIKHINDNEHKKLTGHSNKNILAFAQYLSEKQIPVWLRHVVVPGITYDEKYLSELGEFLGTLKNIKALDILPYHNMAIKKYADMNIDYKLKDTNPLSKEDAIKARNIIISSMKNYLKKVTSKI